MNPPLIALLILIMEFAPAEIYSWPLMAAVVLLLLALRPSFFFTAQNPAIPLLIVLLAGTTFSLGHPAGAVLKDIWYILKPAAIVSLGLIFAYLFRTDRNWMKMMAVVVIAVALAHTLNALTTVALEEGELRPTSFLAAFMAPFVWKFYPAKARGRTIIRAATICAVVGMIALSESRATLLTFGIGWLAAYGALQAGGRALFVFGFITLAIAALFPLLPQYDFHNVSFFGKLQNSLNEVMFETGDSRLDMYRNWRGFEAYRAYATWLQASFPERIVGLGHGTNIDLGRLVTFRSRDVLSLPRLHNVYFELLVKTGVIGLAAYLAFMIRPFSARLRARSAEFEIHSRIVRGGALVMLLTSALISGPLNKTSFDGLLIVWSTSFGIMLLQARAGRRRRVGSRSRPGARRVGSTAPARAF
ncbi:MAG: O-antigen ligase family protein [Erythrobacter sp.]|uniref:O-antigen ligase family protein n=1 Tax=Erythrobacter sp. TaxID=1042 RepID=UPI0032EDCA8E